MAAALQCTQDRQTRIFPLPRGGESARLWRFNSQAMTMQNDALQAAPTDLPLLPAALDAILAASDPSAVLRAGAGVLCQRLAAAGALWLLSDEEGARLVPQGEAAGLLAQAAPLRGLRGAALRHAILSCAPPTREPILHLTLRAQHGEVAALWLRAADQPALRADAERVARLTLDRATLLRGQDRIQQRWTQIFEELPAALALCAADGQVLMTNRQLRALLAEPRLDDELAAEELRAPTPTSLGAERLQPLLLAQRLREALRSGATVLCDEAPQPDGRTLSGALAPLFATPDEPPPSQRAAAAWAAAAGEYEGDEDDDDEGGADDERASSPPPPPSQGRPLGGVLLVHDATDEQRLQRRLLLGERMAAVGQLAAGLAHEINNPVAIAYADLQYARELLEKHQSALSQALPVLIELPEMVDECLVSIRRVRDIVRDLRTFTSTEVRSQPGEARLDDIIEQALRLARTEVQRRARLVYDRDMLPLPTVRGDAGRLGQVVLNLLSQAQHNLPPLELSGPTANRITVRTRADSRRGTVELLVSDSGPTLSEEVRARLFEPFASRRSRHPAGLSAALGMGLAVSYEIVRRLGGDIESHAVPGGGNELLVRLPQFAAQLRAPRPPGLR